LGGPRSTRWNSHRKRPLIEESSAVDLPQLIRAGLFESPTKSFTLTWTRAGEPIAVGPIGLARNDAENRILRVLVRFESGSERLGRI